MPHFDSCARIAGRLNGPLPCSNINSALPEIEILEAMPRGPAPTDDYSALSVTNVKMYEDMNKVAHHTERYDQSKLIIRRGQEFIMGIVFSRPFDSLNDWVNIEFSIGNNPNITQGTLITLTLGGEQKTNTWRCRVVDISGTETKVGITPSTDCITGLFSTYVAVITSMWIRRTKRNPKTDFYILFNPWAPSDQVYMANEYERNEYVLNDTGVIYNGVVNKITSHPWNYGQFKRGVLDACLFLLDFGKMPLQYRGDVAKLVRKASGLINSQDDDGVLVGNWGENFSLGTAPSAWTGSSEILLSYASSGGVPVKFAQCWVYAGTFNTFLRCLGLPARIVTNYCSAHDNMGNLKTDIVLDEDGRMDANYTTDSIWNFHCWNEVFMKRPDIPPAFSGWQVVDATPQQTSDGYYRVGPTSVKAIKEGQLGYQFDAPFVFAEVNSDVVFYKRDKYGNTTTASTNTTYVGQIVVTKMIGSNNPEVITSNYKYPEGSPEDQQTMKQAESRGLTRNKTTLPASDVQLQLWANQSKESDDVNVTIYLINKSKEQRNVNISVTGKVDYYTGATRSVFKFVTRSFTLLPFEAQQELITVTAEEYKTLVMGQPFMSFVAYGFIENLGTSITSMVVFHLDTPPLNIEVSGTLQVGESIYVTVKFTNTVGYDLNNVSLRMEGSGLLPVKTKQYSLIAPGSSVKWIESFIPQLPGTKTLVACLDCAAIRDVCGQLDITIQPENAESN
ncbi:hypothetical protein NFI96_013977 [Prochilodus magdalenae]|nr:hypothetical protein NFI96_013977 [Prochilodus magdalenae]